MKYQTISLIKYLFVVKGMTYVAIATVIFSSAKITRYFHTWRYHVFEQKLTWYFIGVYIINLVKLFFLFIYKYWFRDIP